MRAINDRLKKLIQTEDGSVFVWFLLAIPLLLLVIVFSWDSNDLTFTTNWLQEGLNRSTKAAALQVPALSYALGTPEIDEFEAEIVFREYLAKNLGLDATTLQPRTPRLRSAPEYELVVYNGPFPYRHVDSEYGIDTVLEDPSVISTLKVKYAGFAGRSLTIRRWSIASIKD